MNSFFDTLKYDIIKLKTYGVDFTINLFMFLLTLLIIMFLPILYPAIYILLKNLKLKVLKKEKVIKKHMDRMFPNKMEENSGKELEQMAKKDVIQPCGCTADGDPIQYNPWNKVVQCHKCGAIYNLVK